MHRRDLFRKLTGAFCVFACFSLAPGLSRAGEALELLRLEVAGQSFTAIVSVAEDAEIEVDWGDGTTRTATGPEARIGRNWDDEGPRAVVFRGAESALAGFESGAQITLATGDLPAGLTSFVNTGRNSTLSGETRELPRSLARFLFRGQNSVSGDLRGLPPRIVEFTLEGSNTITGDIAGLPRSLEVFSLHGRNTLAGEIRYLPSGMRSFACRGSNTITGDVRYLPEGLESLDLLGENTISGDVANLPRPMRSLLCHGANSLDGDIADLPRGMTFIDLLGRNEVSGNIKDMPPAMNNFRISGRNTLAGNISDLPEGLVHFRCDGANTIEGNLSDLPAGLLRLELSGRNTVGGDFADLPAGANSVMLGGRNTVNSYTGGRQWPSSVFLVNLAPAAGFGLSTAEVDALLEDLSKVENWVGSVRAITLAGSCAPRSNASDAAVEKLEKAGVRVVTR